MASTDVVVLGGKSPYTLDDLAQRASAPLQAAGVERAIAFGSYARGTADAYSDLDLVVVMRTDLPRLERHRALAPLLEAIPVPVDLLVYTPEEYELGMQRRLGIFDAVAREGVAIYGKEAS
jgi:predicted nucleotidyltransferase